MAITPNTPNPVREDTLMKTIMDALGGSYAGIQTPVWRNEEELEVIARAIAAVVPSSSILPEAPEDDGTYTLTMTVDDGEATLSWEAAE